MDMINKGYKEIPYILFWDKVCDITSSKVKERVFSTRRIKKKLDNDTLQDKFIFESVHRTGDYLYNLKLVNICTYIFSEDVMEKKTNNYFFRRLVAKIEANSPINVFDNAVAIASLVNDNIKKKKSNTIC